MNTSSYSFLLSILTSRFGMTSNWRYIWGTQAQSTNHWARHEVCHRRPWSLEAPVAPLEIWLGNHSYLRLYRIQENIENIRKPMDAKWKPMEAVKMCGCAIWPEKPLAGHFGQSHERCSAVMVCRSRYSRKKREFICAGHQGIWMDMDGFDYLWMFLVSNKDDFQVLLAMLSLGVPPPFEVTTLQAGQRMLTSVALTP